MLIGLYLPTLLFICLCSCNVASLEDKRTTSFRERMVTEHTSASTSTISNEGNSNSLRSLTEQEAEMLNREKVYLNVGGILPAAQWINVNAQYDNEFVDNRLAPNYFLRNVDDLYGVRSRSVSVLYSSHTLEHTSLVRGETARALAEWHRVLRPGGLLFLSVPDLEMLARLYLRHSYPTALRDMLQHMIYGGQDDPFDYHLSGFDERVLRGLLLKAGFCEVERVETFNVFPEDFDASTVVWLFKKPISLNVVARPCFSDELMRQYAPVDFETHSSTPFDRIATYEEVPDYDPATGDFYYIDYATKEKIVLYNYYKP